MLPSEVAVTFQPSGKTVGARQGTALIDAAIEAGVLLDMPCGAEGTCGKCRVVVRQGTVPPKPIERDVISRADLDQGVRLACQASVEGPMTVEIPETSRLGSRYRILARTGGVDTPSDDPVVTKQYIEMSPPRRGDDLADLDRVRRAMERPVDADLDLLRRLPQLLRREKFQGTVVLDEERLIDFEPGNTESESFAVAVDVGTTTLAALLIDLNTGEELGVASCLNPQTRFGDDVLSRITHAEERAENLDELRWLVVEAVDAMIGQLVAESGIARNRLYEIVFSGNTTMQHLLLGIEPGYLGKVPFVSATRNRVTVEATRLGLQIHPRARAYVLPTIGGFVGGDTVAGILAVGLAEVPGPTLLIDVGTNGEIVLAADGKLRATAAAAGPAFEGVCISNGMRGRVGAIEKVTVDRELRFDVIGGSRPTGLCGSALIDLGAELLQHGIITPEGRIQTPDELSDAVLPDMRRRVVTHDDRPAFLVADATVTATGTPILLTQADVRQLQLASGAIRAGIVLLLRQAGLEPSDLRQVFIGGGFGNFIRRSRAQRIGLLPLEIPRERISYQGNTSLAGARLAAASRSARRQAEHLARQTEHLDLSTDPDFSWTFADAMIFPSPTRQGPTRPDRSP